MKIWKERKPKVSNCQYILSFVREVNIPIRQSGTNNDEEYFTRLFFGFCIVFMVHWLLQRYIMTSLIFERDYISCYTWGQWQISLQKHEYVLLIFIHLMILTTSFSDSYCTSKACIPHLGEIPILSKENKEIMYFY